MSDEQKPSAPGPTSTGTPAGEMAGGTAGEGTPATPAGAKPAAKPATPPRPAAKAPGDSHAGDGQKAAPIAGLPEPAPAAGVAVPSFITRAQSVLGSKIEKVIYWVGEWSIRVSAEHLLETARLLRDDPDTAFDFCSDVTAADYPTRAQRFDVVHHLYSTKHRTRVRVKVSAGENDHVPAVTGIWPAANWLEREVYDMFGVNFTGHPDRRRILMPEDWQGFPQRKDYPLEGPGELLMENPLEWLRLRQARDEQGE